MEFLLKVMDATKSLHKLYNCKKGSIEMVALVHGSYMIIIQINLSCRQIFQSHGSYGSNGCIYLLFPSTFPVASEFRFCCRCRFWPGKKSRHRTRMSDIMSRMAYETKESRFYDVFSFLQLEIWVISSQQHVRFLEGN